MARWAPHGRIDAHVAAAVAYLRSKQTYFEVREIILLVKTGIPQTRLRGLVSVLDLLRRAAKDWELEEAVLGHVEKRAKACLHQTKSYYFNKERVEVREFESYQDASGRHRWQPIGAMTADELTLCVQQRRRRMRGEEIRIDVYEALISELRQHSTATRVEDIHDQVLKISSN